MGIDRGARRAVFLDRDGVINRTVVREGKPYPPDAVSDVEVLPGVPEAMRRLRAAGYLLVVVTNQPDVARGTQSRARIDAIHARLTRDLPLDDVRCCYHDDDDACECRKPKPGLLVAAAAAHGIDLAASVMVGDRWRDIEAGLRAGVRATVLVDYGYREGISVDPDLRVPSLAAAVDWILATHPPRSR